MDAAGPSNGVLDPVTALGGSAWQRRTNVWRKRANPALAPKRLRSGPAHQERSPAPHRHGALPHHGEKTMKCVIFSTVILTTLIVAAPSRAEVNVVSSTEYYVVRGATAPEVNKYINEFGPLQMVTRKGKNDVRAWGTTGWKIVPKA